MTFEKNAYRIEKDLLGQVTVPANALYGAQTQRAIVNFPLGGEKCFSDYPELLRAMLLIKKAVTQANLLAGVLDKARGEAMIHAIDKLLADTPGSQFPVHSLHGGGGVSFNMNVNEVIANFVNREAFDAPFGSYSPVHPHNHVNLNQSTSDVFSTACHIAVIDQWQELAAELAKLAAAFHEQGQRWQTVQKISRTCLQDAVEISFADFFSGYQTLVSREQERAERAVEELYAVNLGGTIVGRACDANADYRERIIPVLREVLDNARYCQRSNLFDAAQNLDDVVHVSSHLKLLAKNLVKIGQDIRLIASGPQTGFGEIRLPAVQPGSSAMPGKINPTVPEFLMQCCFQVVGKCTATEMVLDHGELDLNVWGAVVVTNLLDAISCLENGARVFRSLCIEGIEVNLEKNRKNIETTIPLINRLKLEKGYTFATKVFKETKGDSVKIKRHLDRALSDDDG